jgi:hypothetical protein
MTYRITINDDAAEMIAVAFIQEHLKIHTDQLHNHKHNDAYLHEDDVKDSKKLIKAFNRILSYCGH